MRGTLSAVATLVLLSCLARPGAALIYLPENTLESLLVKSDGVVIGVVSAVNETENRGSLHVEDSLKGNAKDTIALTSVTIRLTTTTRKARFAKGDRIILFLAAEQEGSRQVLHSQKLENDAEVKTMKTCVAEVTPFAQVLTDLADPKKEIALEPLQKALTTLVASKNAYTQILIGRLMTTRLTGSVKPETCEPILITALQSKRTELVKGALAWCDKYDHLPATIRPHVEKISRDFEDPATKDAAGKLLKEKA